MTETPPPGQDRRAERELIGLAINLGPGKHLVDLSELVDHLAAVVDLGIDFHMRSVELQALRQVLPAQEEGIGILPVAQMLGSDWVERLSYSLGQEFSSALKQYLRDSALTVTVKRLNYENPFDVQLSLSLISEHFVAVLKVIRDWTADRRIRKAEAEDFESVVRTREQLRGRVLAQLDEDSDLPPWLIADLLTPRRLEAIDALAGAGPEITYNERPLPK